MVDFWKPKVPKHALRPGPHKFQPIKLFADSDRDGVANVFDCQPHNKRKQDLWGPTGNASLSSSPNIAPSLLRPKPELMSPSGQFRVRINSEFNELKYPNMPDEIQTDEEKEWRKRDIEARKKALADQSQGGYYS